jgi:hypothetical protein
MQCAKVCFSVTKNRYESVQQVYDWCLNPICDCKQNPNGPIDYTYSTNFNETQ